MLALRKFRRGRFWDAIWWLRTRLAWGLRKSRDASQPVNSSSVDLSLHIKCLPQLARRVVLDGGVPLVGPSPHEELRGPSVYSPERLLRAHGGRRSKDFRVLY